MLLTTTISGTAIAATVPDGTDVTALVVGRVSKHLCRIYPPSLKSMRRYRKKGFFFDS